MKPIVLLALMLTPAAVWGQAQECRFENGTLNGAYALTITGTAGSPVWTASTGPVATIGMIVFDGMGNFQVAASTIVGANPPLNVTVPGVITGSYTVNQDCSGTLTFNFTPNPNAHYNNMVVSPNGGWATMIATDKGDVLTGTATRLRG